MYVYECCIPAKADICMFLNGSGVSFVSVPKNEITVLFFVAAEGNFANRKNSKGRS